MEEPAEEEMSGKRSKRLRRVVRKELDKRGFGHLDVQIRVKEKPRFIPQWLWIWLVQKVVESTAEDVDE